MSDGIMTEIMTTQTAAISLNLTQRRVAGLCAAGKLNGAAKMGKTWLIPALSVLIYKATHAGNGKRQGKRTSQKREQKREAEQSCLR